MKEQIERNRSADQGRNNDDQLRDQSGIQPGASTIKRSDTDSANEALSETAGDGFRKGKKDERADPRFDEDRTKEDL